MAGSRDLRVNFERMWREVDELMGAPFGEGWVRKPQGWKFAAWQSCPQPA